MGKLVEASSWSGTGLGLVSRERLITRLCKSQQALFRTLQRLSHPHAAAFAETNIERLEAEVLNAAEFSVKTYPWAPTPQVLDVVLAAAFKADISAHRRLRIFGGVSLEKDLVDPVTRHLTRNNYTVRDEVPVGSSRADLIGFGREWLERIIWTVELKNAAQEVERLEEQIRDYRRASDHVVVVMTPECAAEVSLCRGEIAAPKAFAKRAEKWGAQLWIYDATDGEFEQVTYGTTAYEPRHYDALWQSLTVSQAV
jgi:cob(I)alamin adenosyltransferase